MSQDEIEERLSDLEEQKEGLEDVITIFTGHFSEDLKQVKFSRLSIMVAHARNLYGVPSPSGEKGYTIEEIRMRSPIFNKDLPEDDPGQKPLPYGPSDDIFSVVPYNDDSDMHKIFFSLGKKETERALELFEAKPIHRTVGDTKDRDAALADLQSKLNLSQTRAQRLREIEENAVKKRESVPVAKQLVQDAENNRRDAEQKLHNLLETNFTDLDHDEYINLIEKRTKAHSDVVDAVVYEANVFIATKEEEILENLPENKREEYLNREKELREKEREELEANQKKLRKQLEKDLIKYYKQKFEDDEKARTSLIDFFKPQFLIEAEEKERKQLADLSNEDLAKNLVKVHLQTLALSDSDATLLSDNKTFLQPKIWSEHMSIKLDKKIDMLDDKWKKEYYAKGFETIDLKKTFKLNEEQIGLLRSRLTRLNIADSEERDMSDEEIIKSFKERSLLTFEELLDKFLETGEPGVEEYAVELRTYFPAALKNPDLLFGKEGEETYFRTYALDHETDEDVKESRSYHEFGSSVILNGYNAKTSDLNAFGYNRKWMIDLADISFASMKKLKTELEAYSKKGWVEYLSSSYPFILKEPFVTEERRGPSRFYNNEYLEYFYEPFNAGSFEYKNHNDAFGSPYRTKLVKFLLSFRYMLGALLVTRYTGDFNGVAVPEKKKEKLDELIKYLFSGTFTYMRTLEKELGLKEDGAGYVYENRKTPIIPSKNEKKILPLVFNISEDKGVDFYEDGTKLSGYELPVKWSERDLEPEGARNSIFARTLFMGPAEDTQEVFEDVLLYALLMTAGELSSPWRTQMIIDSNSQKRSAYFLYKMHEAITKTDILTGQTREEGLAKRTHDIFKNLLMPAEKRAEEEQNYVSVTGLNFEDEWNKYKSSVSGWAKFYVFDFDKKVPDAQDGAYAWAKKLFTGFAIDLNLIDVNLPLRESYTQLMKDSNYLGLFDLSVYLLQDFIMAMPFKFRDLTQTAEFKELATLMKDVLYDVNYTSVFNDKFEDFVEDSDKKLPFAKRDDPTGYSKYKYQDEKTSWFGFGKNYKVDQSEVNTLAVNTNRQALLTKQEEELEVQRIVWIMYSYAFKRTLAILETRIVKWYDLAVDSITKAKEAVEEALTLQLKQQTLETIGESGEEFSKMIKDATKGSDRLLSRLEAIKNDAKDFSAKAINEVKWATSFAQEGDALGFVGVDIGGFVF